LDTPIPLDPAGNQFNAASRDHSHIYRVRRPKNWVYAVGFLKTSPTCARISS